MKTLSQRITLIISLLAVFFTLVTVTSVIFIRYLPSLPSQNQLIIKDDDDNNDIIKEGEEIAVEHVAKTDHHSGTGINSTVLIMGCLIFVLMLSISLNFAMTWYFTRTLEKLFKRDHESNPHVHIQTSSTPMIEKTTQDASDIHPRSEKEEEKKTDDNQ